MLDNNLKVHVFMGGYDLIKKSGVGKAIMHQKEILSGKGISVNQVGFFDSDIVHINTIFPDSVIAALLAKMAGIKVIYYGHSTMEDFKNSFIGSNIIAPVFKHWISFCYSLGDVIITPTQYSKSILLNYGIAKPIVALSNGIDASFWKTDRTNSPDFHKKEVFCKKYGMDKDKKVIMSVGHYIDRKGIVEFIEAAKRNPDYNFIWFGYTSLNIVPAHIKEAIESAPDNLYLPGFVDKEELRQAYEASDVFLFMSHEETEGIVILEAMATGIPTIVRDIPVYEGWLFNNINVYKFKDDLSVDLMLDYVMNVDNSAIVFKAHEMAMERDYDKMSAHLIKTYERYLSVG